VTQVRPEDLLRNRLLAGLDDAERARLAPLLEPVEAVLRTPVYDPGEAIEHVYFPLRCVFSLVAVVGDDVIEVSTIGNEGMVGLPVFLGAAVSPNSAFCQVPGPALRMRAPDLVTFLSHWDGTMHSRLHRYTQATIVQLAQSVACNQLHTTHQRTARWLLMTRDRVDQDSFTLTQEFLAQMLGVRRATVSGIAAEFQAAGLIAYNRGTMSITDPAGLETLTCECYRVIQDEYDQLLDGGRS